MEIFTSPKLAQLLLCEQLYQKKSIPVKELFLLLPFTVSSAHAWQMGYTTVATTVTAIQLVYEKTLENYLAPTLLLESVYFTACCLYFFYLRSFMKPVRKKT